MGQDYNIYIRDLTGGSGGQRKPTEAKTPEEKETATSTFKAFKGEVAGDVAAGMAIAWGVAKVVESAIDTVLPFVEAETGNYLFGIQYNNTKKVISAVLNPIGAIIGEAKRQQNIRLREKQLTEQRALLGDTLLNSYGGKM